MGRAVGLRVQEEALSVCSDLRPIVGRFDQEWEDAGLQLATYVDKRVTEWATVVHRTLSSKVNLPAALVRALLLKVPKVRLTSFDLLESLTEDCLLTLVIYLSTITKDLGFSSTYSDGSSGAFIHSLDLFIKEFILDSSKH